MQEIFGGKTSPSWCGGSEHALLNRTETLKNVCNTHVLRYAKFDFLYYLANVNFLHHPDGKSTDHLMDYG